MLVIRHLDSRGKDSIKRYTQTVKVSSLRVRRPAEGARKDFEGSAEECDPSQA